MSVLRWIGSLISRSASWLYRSLSCHLRLRRTERRPIVDTPAGPYAKLYRGDEHLQSLESDLNAWVESGPDRIVTERNAECTEYSFRLSLVNPPDFTNWALKAGDAIFNYRCALDHLVYELAVRNCGGGVPPHNNVIQFPIVTDEGWFDEKSRLIRALRETLPSETLTIIRGLQPYEGRNQALLRLQELNNLDKHKTLALSIVRLSLPGSQLSFNTKVSEGKMDVTFPLRGLEDGALSLRGE